MKPFGSHEDAPRKNGCRPGPMKKIGYLAGAIVCLIGLFYFVLMLTR